MGKDHGQRRVCVQALKGNSLPAAEQEHINAFTICTAVLRLWRSLVLWYDDLVSVYLLANRFSVLYTVNIHMPYFNNSNQKCSILCFSWYHWIYLTLCMCFKLFCLKCQIFMVLLKKKKKMCWLIKQICTSQTIMYSTCIRNGFLYKHSRCGKCLSKRVVLYKRLPFSNNKMLVHCKTYPNKANLELHQEVRLQH